MALRIATLAVALVLAGCDESISGRVARATALADRCEFEAALQVVDALPADELSASRLGNLRARLLLQLGRGNEAAGLLARSDARDREEKAEATLLRGLAQAAAGEWPGAATTLEAAIQLGADPALATGAAGMGALVHGDDVEAERLLLQALDDDPNLTGALYNLACLRSSQGRLAESAALLRRAWAFGWQHVAELKAEPRMAKLRAKPGLVADLLEQRESRCPGW